jgi:gliding motility-associated-like protein
LTLKSGSYFKRNWVKKTRAFSVALNAARVKQGMRYLFFLTFFLPDQLFAQSPIPKPNWVDNLGGSSGYSVATCLAVDKQNDVYVAGEFEGTVDFDPTSRVKNLTSAGGYDIFIGKYKQDGTLIWVESIGGTGSEQPYGLAVDKDGNASIVGSFSSTVLDANPGPGVFNLTGSAGGSIFTIHLDTNGNFLWANSFQGGFGPEALGSFGVAADSQDDVITTAEFSTTFIVGDSTYTPGDASNGLIIKYGSTGNVLWSVNLTSTDEDNVDAYAASVDGQDNIIISGNFTSTVNLNPLGAPYNLTSPANSPAFFVAKYAPTGNLVWASEINSPSADIFIQSAVSTDAQNNVYFSTPFEGSVTFGSTTLNATENYGPNISFAKYSASGVLQFAKSIGGPGNLNYGSVIATDKSSNLYMAGYFNGTVNFNTNAGNDKNISAHGPLDFYVAKYDANGNYIYAFNGGSADCANTSAQSLAIDTNYNVDVAGAFCSSVNFDPSGCFPDTVTATSTIADAFVAQYAAVPPIANNVITAPAINHFCVTATNATITGSLPTGGSGAYVYQWQSSTDSVNFVPITGAIGQNYTPDTLKATTYFQRSGNATSCAAPTVSNIVALHIVALPPNPVVPGFITCVGNTATLSITSPQPGLTYNWFTAATGDTSVFTGTSFNTPALDVTTSYYVESVNTTGCISATRTVTTVTIEPPLVAPVVTVGPTTASSIIFEWAAVPGATGYQVSFDNGQTFTAVIGLADTLSGLQVAQSVTIVVEATGIVPCQLSPASTAVTAIAISPTDDIIYVANVFTPNGDGTNDVVHVHGINIKSVRFYIFDQWGEMLFTSTSTQNGWDGTFKGAREPVGVYVYMVEAVMNDGRTVNKKGTVTLVR